ncbi:hypothetical protein [Nocardia sp. IFM 10818]
MSTTDPTAGSRYRSPSPEPEPVAAPGFFPLVQVITCDGCGCPLGAVTEQMIFPAPRDVYTNAVYVVCPPEPGGTQSCLHLARLWDELWRRIRCPVPECDGTRCHDRFPGFRYYRPPGWTFTPLMGRLCTPTACAQTWEFAQALARRAAGWRAVQPPDTALCQHPDQRTGHDVALAAAALVRGEDLVVLLPARTAGPLEIAVYAHGALSGQPTVWVRATAAMSDSAADVADALAAHIPAFTA